MVTIPITCQTSCKKCGTHQPHKVTQYKKGRNCLCAQGKQHHGGKQRGCGGQTKPIFQKEAQTLEEMVLRPESTKPSCTSMRTLAIQRHKHCEL
ncbi:60S ribosomal protein L36a-like [Rhinolophus ferrumequinum]|uniref:60S ribosomal protein L36a-like n=1 Tax=Rhinolophus ferrumequinum TaxID=59479 RepID=UPI00140F9D48|nr:60S ribosomal protein L36a-like [Rhinolophus ferrumequinum]